MENKEPEGVTDDPQSELREQLLEQRKLNLDQKELYLKQAEKQVDRAINITNRSVTYISIFLAIFTIFLAIVGAFGIMDRIKSTSLRDEAEQTLAKMQSYSDTVHVVLDSILTSAKQKGVEIGLSLP